MVWLVLDLDETTLVVDFRKNYINQAHELSSPFEIKNGEKTFSAQLINPKELSDLITTAYQNHDGVIILTSGGYDDSVRIAIADHLEVDAQIKHKLKNCHYFSVYEDMQLNLHHDVVSLEDIREIPKVIRIERVAKHLGLNDAKFVLLDDSVKHCISCKYHESIKGVLATIEYPVKSFYNNAKNALDAFKIIEQETLAPKVLTSFKKRKSDTDLKPSDISLFRITNDKTTFIGFTNQFPVKPKKMKYSVSL